MQILMRALSSLPFANYRVWWSLADSKYAGTALFVKKCFQPKKVFFNLDRTGILFRNLLYTMAETIMNGLNSSGVISCLVIVLCLHCKQLLKEEDNSLEEP